MNILFLTLVQFNSLQERNIYTDLLREFVKNGHRVFAISPVEKKQCVQTHMIKEKGARILRLQIGNTQKTNIIEKGISTVLIEPTFKKAIKQFFSKVRFDLVLYSTPPITLVNAINYAKKRDKARTYLLLKDIFPQNAVDMGMLTDTGIKGLLYKYFRNKEKKLYKISDNIGCMSQANVDYVLKHNPQINPQIVEICPNSIEVIDKSVGLQTRKKIRKKYGIPLDKKVFVYGGNLGKPQGIPFLIRCIKKCKNLQDAFFMIVGDGTEYELIDEFIKINNPNNLMLLKSIPKDEYDLLVAACDVGMICLDHRFTIPNFPSRLLSYMQAKLPVLAITDNNTDIGRVITRGEFGWWVESNDAYKVRRIIEQILTDERIKYKSDNSWNYLKENYSVCRSAGIIVNSILSS